MSFYTPSVAVDPLTSQHTSQALVLANNPYQSAGAMHYPTGRNSYMYGSYGQPVQYGRYPQSVPVYVQPPHQQVMYTVPSYGYGNHLPMSMNAPYGTSVIVQDPYGYSRRRSRRHRRYSHGGYY